MKATKTGITFLRQQVGESDIFKAKKTTNGRHGRGL